jgi:diguanylate cyclase (GGDEF)-like protein
MMMSKRAQAYVGGVLGAGILLGVLAYARFTSAPDAWAAFAVLTTLATLAQLFKVEAPNHVLFYASPIFFFAGVLLLPPFLIVLLVAIPHLMEWGKERWRGSPHLRAWYLQPFNIAMTSIATVSTYWLYVGLTAQAAVGATIEPAIVGLIAAISYVCLNHLLLGLALVLARGVSWRDSGVLDTSNLLTDIVLACLGLVVATIWRISPGFIVPALAPLVLMYRALMIPQLKHLAEVDAKVGLANAGHFRTLFEAELTRAIRFHRPLAVIMADLDLLRDINNTHGHLAGDAVLAAIGRIIRQTIREFDIAGRFGGEEFALILPEAEPHAAEALAERLRQAVAAELIPVGTRGVPITVTMSLGVACFPGEGHTADQLLFAADVAVYEAKSRGRNCVARAADLPWDRRVAHPAGDVSYVPSPWAGDGGHQAPADDAKAAALPPAPTSVETTTATATLPVHEAPLADRRGDESLETPRDHEAQTLRPARLSRLLPQPVVGFTIMLLAIVALAVVALSRQASLGEQPIAITLEALIFAGAIVVGYQYPVHIRLHVKIQGTTMIYFLIAVQLPLPLAAVTAGLGTLLGEVSVRLQRKLYPSDIATAVGRWTLLVLLGALVAHTSATGNMALAAAVACALVLGVGDLITLPLILAPMTGERPRSVLRALAVETALPEAVQYVLGFTGVLLAQRAEWALTLLIVPTILVYQAFTHLHEIQDSTHLLLESLADAVDMRDTYTGGHSRRVTAYCKQILREMKLAGPDRDLILSAARVHDIGKIALPDAILNKSGPLTAEERALMQTHPERGANVLRRHKDFIRGVAIVLHHHEAWDGSGYPHKLKGTEIPFGARVLAVADSFDAMISDRPYRRGMPVARACDILRQGRAQQWDKQVVEAFLRSIADQIESPQRPLLQVVGALDADASAVGA